MVTTLVFVFEILFGMTGIFWLAGGLTLPILIVGLAIGEEQPEGSEPEVNQHRLATER